MKKYFSTYELSKMININIDTEEIYFKGNVYKNCLERPVNELSQWLYCNVHNSNSFLLDGEKLGRDIKDECSDLIDDNYIMINPRIEFFGGQKYYSIDGIRICKAQGTNFPLKIPSKRPNLTPGFFMYIHSNEFLKYRYYVGSSSSLYAMKIWSNGIKKLVSLNVQFSAKILSNTGSYPRNDAVVFYTNDDRDIVEKVLTGIVNEFKHPDGYLFDQSPYTEKITGTLTKAEQPINKGDLNKSLGEHRSELTALAIKDSITTGMDFLTLLNQRFCNANVDLSNISRNEK